MDVLVAALQSTGLLSREGVGYINDRLDRKAAYALQKSHKATAISIMAAATSVLISRAAIVWS